MLLAQSIDDLEVSLTKGPRPKRFLKSKESQIWVGWGVVLNFLNFVLVFYGEIHFLRPY